MSEKTWREAIVAALTDIHEPLHYKEIAERIATLNLKKTLGVTPDATVGAQLYMWVKEANSPFERVGKGTFKRKKTDDVLQLAPELNDFEEEVEPTEAGGGIKAMGIYWRRDLVHWASTPKLMGRQQVGAQPIDFAQQVGVYLLHDRDRTIYVGRASDAISARLRIHTLNRLSSRWDRFSWFGLRGVHSDGSGLKVADQTWSSEAVLTALEAILIESLEPPLNRRQGDGFATTEYIQVEDPTIERAKRKLLLAELAKNAGLNL